MDGSFSLDRTHRTYDAIIVGSGMGGSAVALRLAQAGLNVLIVERGDWLPKPANATNNTFLYDIQAPEDDFEIVGGRSKYYGAALYRFRESDFEARDFENGPSPAWPIRYADLEPYYAEAERLYRVHGSPDGDPSEPFRTGPYPHMPLPNDPQVNKVATQLKKAGVNVAAIPRGIDYGDEGLCVLCAQCDAHLCRFDAKMDAETATLRPALQTGHVELLAKADCLTIELSEDGRRAVGVRVHHDGAEHLIRAGIVVTAAGYPHTPALLRRSRFSAHPEGLGNQGGWLGKGVGAHSTGTLFPMIRFTAMGDRHTKTFAINQWFEGDDPGSDWPYPLGVSQIAGQTPFWNMAGALKRPAIRAVAERSLTVFHMTEATPSKETGWSFDGDALGAFTPPVHHPGSYERLRNRTQAAFRAAGYFVLSPHRDVAFWHETGGAIMGDDPGSSVIDATGQVHGVDGLYVADATALPSASAVNTGLTIVAFALRTADIIACGKPLDATVVEPAPTLKVPA
ncbi:MAG: GMC family oxidoreductase [Pseudomonadota bacterium]